MSVVPTQVLPDVMQDSYWQKGWKKCKQQPFVPIGILATCVAFIGATRQLRTGDKKSFNRFLRMRVIAQGVTIAACVGGSYFYSRQAAIDKAQDREIELEKIRVAGTGAKSRVLAASAVPDATSTPPTSPTTQPIPTSPSPGQITGGDFFWSRWGGTGKGKEEQNLDNDAKK